MQGPWILRLNGQRTTGQDQGCNRRYATALLPCNGHTLRRKEEEETARGEGGGRDEETSGSGGREGRKTTPLRVTNINRPISSLGASPSSFPFLLFPSIIPSRIDAGFFPVGYLKGRLLTPQELLVSISPSFGWWLHFKENI